ncbi:nitrate/nitrite two-component system sensor histidine kinase NarQ [Aliivibrio kagoshimensis]|uniref:nitrate/nitrite two-component system sensor histidine kinase NarQ n=1 Tax=Aliivibrio kagoshimensis TaxID=2910230 RepID=UPI003D0E6C42
MPNTNTTVTSTVARVMILILILSLTTTSVALLTLSSSLKDAAAVNVSGSLRMQSYRLALDIETQSPLLEQHLASFVQSLESPSLTSVENMLIPAHIEQQYHHILYRWTLLEPMLQHQNKQAYLQEVSQFVEEIDLFVFQLQQLSENKLKILSLIGGAGLGLIFIATLFIIRFTQKKIVYPLNQLVAASKEMKQGNFNLMVNIPGDNEIARLGHTFNRMAKELGDSYHHLEQTVENKTRKVSQANSSLQVLYQCSQQLSESELSQENFQIMLNTLVKTEGLIAVKLTVEEDNGAVWEIHAGEPLPQEWHKEPLILDGETLGYLSWQYELPCPDQDLILNVVNILSRGLYYNQSQKQSQQLLLMDERAAIARELHDSLAQALSYLKIQTTVLKRQIGHCDCANTEETNATLNELDEGLKSAYQELRELLSTFRLTIKETNFNDALEEILKPLTKQSDATISVNNSLSSIPLDAHHHVHLLQLIREGVLNAIKHSTATKISIISEQIDDHGHITITDNGTGFDSSINKTNHYGLSIMQERANRINGEISIKSEPNLGCQIRLVFPLHIQ